MSNTKIHLCCCHGNPCTCGGLSFEHWVVQELNDVHAKLDELRAKRKSHGTKAQSQARKHDEAVDAFMVRLTGGTGVESDLLGAWVGYCEMRKDKKKWLTAHAIDLVLKKLAPFTIAEQVEALNKSTRNGYTDVYPESTDGAKPLLGEMY